MLDAFCMSLNVWSDEVNDSSTFWPPIAPVKWNVYVPGRLGSIGALYSPGELKTDLRGSTSDFWPPCMTSTFRSSAPRVTGLPEPSRTKICTALLTSENAGSTFQPTTNWYVPTVRRSCAAAGARVVRMAPATMADSARTRANARTGDPPRVKSGRRTCSAPDARRTALAERLGRRGREQRGAGGLEPHLDDDRRALPAPRRRRC